MRRIRLFGHPLHPPTTHFPLGLLCTVPVWDGLALVQGGVGWWAVAHWTLALGLVLALPAALTGLLDYAAIPAGAPPESTARAHLITTLSGVGLATASFLLRVWGDGVAPQHTPVAVGLAASAALVLGVGGWLGAELTFGHGVGVRAADESSATGKETAP